MTKTTKVLYRLRSFNISILEVNAILVVNIRNSFKDYVLRCTGEQTASYPEFRLEQLGVET